MIGSKYKPESDEGDNDFSHGADDEGACPLREQGRRPILLAVFVAWLIGTNRVTNHKPLDISHFHAAIAARVLK